MVLFKRMFCFIYLIGSAFDSMVYCSISRIIVLNLVEILLESNKMFSRGIHFAIFFCDLVRVNRLKLIETMPSTR